MPLRKISFCYALCIILTRKTIWTATHDELPQCGTAGVYKTRQTLLQSPNYPDNYEPNTCLDYVIRSPFRCPTKFHIQFLDFILELSANCSNDYLAIGLQNDGDDMDLLCGQVVGIKKYHTPDGILRLRFYANDSPWTTAKGFKILITRLACEREELIDTHDDTSDDNDTEEISTPATQLSPPHNTLPAIFKNSSLQDQHVPVHLPPLFGSNYLNPLINYLLLPPPTQQTTGFDSINSNAQLPQQNVLQFHNTLQKPCRPEHTQLAQLDLSFLPNQYNSWQLQNFAAKSSAGNTQTRPFETYEPCCASSFAQKRFYLSSPGFPRTAFTALLPTQQRDCQFQIEKASENICRLRIDLKFFDFGQTYSGTGAKEGNINVAIDTSRDVCTEDFIEIDGERFCGCRTGYVYNSYWGSGTKTIRMRLGYSGIPSSGFLLDILQEDCSGLVHQANSFTNLGQQQDALNLFGINGQQSTIGNQQQIYPIYQPFLTPFIYPMSQFRSARNLQFTKSQSSHQPVSVVETNSTRKEYYYFDGDEAFERARLLDEPDDPDKTINKSYAASRGRCSFDSMDILRLSVDFNWISKPTCYSPQRRLFSNQFG